MSQRAVVASGVEITQEDVRAAWMPRAIVSGFAASVMLLFTYLLAFGLALGLARVQWTSVKGGSDLGAAFNNLVNNPFVDLARSNLYVALALFLAGGLIWAAVYARVFEPRLPGAPWQQGMLFSLIPFLVSVAIVFPAIGGGIFGAALGAGPLPVIGNLILHLVYGAVLGTVYGPFGDTIQVVDGEAWEPALERRVLMSSERTAARWLIGGLVVGLVLGAGLALFLNFDGNTGIFGTASIAFMIATALIVGAFGALVGSLAGISPGHEPR